MKLGEDSEKEDKEKKKEKCAEQKTEAEGKVEGGEGERAAAAVGEEKDQKPSNTCILYVNSFSILIKH